MKIIQDIIKNPKVVFNLKVQPILGVSNMQFFLYWLSGPQNVRPSQSSISTIFNALQCVDTNT